MRTHTQPLAVAVVVGSVLAMLAGPALLQGCGGNNSVTPPPPPAATATPTATPPTITVSLPAQTTFALDAGQSVALSATVNGDPRNLGVKWTIQCAGGVLNCGQMATPQSASGAPDVFTAPGALGLAELATVFASAAACPNCNSPSFGIAVNPKPTVNPPPPQMGQVGANFNFGLTSYIVGGTPPMTWGIVSGMLPAGLTYNASTGVVSGIPTAVGAPTVVVFSATDAGSPPIAVNESLSIGVGPPLPIAITNASLPNGTAGAAYGSVTQLCFRFGGFYVHRRGTVLSATGGLAPYSWSWAAASGSTLPAGLNIINCFFAHDHLLSGVPTAAGTYNVIVTVADAENPPLQASAPYTIVIATPVPTPTPTPTPVPTPVPTATPTPGPTPTPVPTPTPIPTRTPK